MYEELTDETKRRYSLFPIEYPEIFEMYEKQVSCFWNVHEIDMSADYNDFQKLTEDEKETLKLIFAFFSNADGIISWGLGETFLKEITVNEALMTFQFLLYQFKGE
jgi:ribonucleoside-diphosphate reductase subunit M2